MEKAAVDAVAVMSGVVRQDVAGFLVVFWGKVCAMVRVSGRKIGTNLAGLFAS